MALRVTREQKIKIMLFLKQNPAMLNIRADVLSQEEKDNLWKQLASILNSMPGGALKDWKRWKKSAADIRSAIKHKRIRTFIYDTAPDSGDGEVDDTLDVAIRNLTCPKVLAPVQKNDDPEIDSAIDTAIRNLTCPKYLVATSGQQAVQEPEFVYVENVEPEERKPKERGGAVRRKNAGDKLVELVHKDWRAKPLGRFTMKDFRVEKLKFKMKFKRRKLELLKREMAVKEKLASSLFGALQKLRAAVDQSSDVMKT